MHKDLAKLAEANEQPSLCCFAGQCLCSEEGRKVFWYQKRLGQTIAKQFPAKTNLRRALGQGDIVLRLSPQAGGAAHWFHISWVNMTTWHMSWLPLDLDEDAIRKELAAPGIALRVRHDAAWRFSWAYIEQLDVDSHWEAAFWMLTGNPFQVRSNFEPWSLQVERILPPAVFWTGKPPPRPRRPPQDRVAAPSSSSGRAGPRNGADRRQNSIADREIAPACSDDRIGEQPPPLQVCPMRKYRL
jgi:hypothetical protein